MNSEVLIENNLHCQLGINFEEDKNVVNTGHESDLETIKSVCPLEIQRFRELLWKRHLMLSGLRKRDKEITEHFKKENDDFYNKWLVRRGSITIIATMILCF